MTELKGLRISFLALTLGNGGAERQLYYMLTALKRSGAIPRVLSLTRGEFWEEKIRAANIPITYVGGVKSRLYRLWRISSELQSNRPDIVQSQHFFANFYAAAASSIIRVPCVGAVRNDGVSRIQIIGRPLKYLSLRMPSFLAVNSVNAIRNLSRQGVPIERLRLLQNVVDTEEFRPLQLRDACSGCCTLLAVGRLTSVKRYDRLLRITAELQRDHSNFKLVIAGDGPLRGPLESQARTLGLLPHVVEFHGSVSEVNRLCGEADVFVFTSDSEGTPNVVLEAMSSGLPVVSTPVGDVPELIEDGATGFIVGGDDVSSWAITLRRLVREPQLRADVGRRARDFVIEHHSLKSLPNTLSRLYRDMLA